MVLVAVHAGIATVAMKVLTPLFTGPRLFTFCHEQ